MGLVNFYTKDEKEAAQFMMNGPAVKNKIMAEINKFGSDVEISFKKAFVSLRRKKQFTIIQPSTKVRPDVGLNIKGVAPSGIVEDGSKWNSMCTHRIKVQEEKTINKDLFNWIKQSYDQAG